MSEHVVRTTELVAALAASRQARLVLLEALGCRSSNRDPLAKFSGRIVAAMVGAAMAESRGQRGWDVAAPDGEHIQFRYLANPPATWVNEHPVDLSGDCDAYALVVIEDFEPRHVLIFRKDCLAEVGAALGKRHPSQDTILQLTRRNYRMIVEQAEPFAGLGVHVVGLGALL